VRAPAADDRLLIGPRPNSATTTAGINDVGQSVREDVYALAGDRSPQRRLSNSGYTGVVYAPVIPPSTKNAVAFT